MLFGSIKVGTFSFAGVLSLAQLDEYHVKWSSSISGIGKIGYVGTIAGILGDSASGGMMYTLGNGACIGAGVRLSASASTLVGGARMGGGVDLSTGAIGGVGGCVDRTAALNRSASWRMARIYVLPNERNDEAGAGFSNASASILDALAALSAEEVAGMMVLWGENYTVRTMRSDLVFVT